MPSECPLSGVPKYPSAFRVSQMFECLLMAINILPVSECLIRCDWNEILSTKDILCTCKKKKIRVLIWKAFEFSFRYLVFVKIES